jgi:hypothetical protein
LLCPPDLAKNHELPGRQVKLDVMCSVGVR